MNRGPILLIEDSADDVALTLDAFEHCHITNEIVVARDGAAALEELFGQGRFARDGIPALALLDLKLPKLDGLEVLRRIRAEKRTRCMPVIVLTSSNEASDIITSYDLGANSYLRKPIDFDEFLAVVENFARYWLRLNKVPTAT